MTLVAAVSAAALIGALGGPWLLALGLILTLGIAAAALTWGALSGLVAATLGAATLVSALSVLPGWGESAFWPTVAVVVVLAALAVAAGKLGQALQARIPAPVTGPDAVHPQSVGILTDEAGRLRLAEELERARVTGAPLAMATVRVDTRSDCDLPERAARAVMRAMDARVRPTDVPFVAGPGELKLVLPDTSGIEALAVLADVTAGLHEASFADRDSGQRVRLVDSAEVRIEVTAVDPATAGAKVLSAGLRGGAR